MRIQRLATVCILSGVITVTGQSDASPLDQFQWKKRVLVVIAPAGDDAAKEQRQIYESATEGMSERSIVLTEAIDNSARSREIRSHFGTDGRRFKVFLIGKDGNAAISSDKPLSADYLFDRVDAMPMRQDELRNAR